jgi:phosphoglycolate phosphatase-like HAD superfamily hydrolase
VGRLLVLWDVDYTLVDSDGIGRQLYEIALRELFGLPLPQSSSMSGRTDRAIALEVLTLAGVPEPETALGPFHDLMAAHAADLAGLVVERSRALAGAAEAISALAALDVVQSLLTGNMRPLAEVKLGPLGLTEHLDLAVGAYGDAHAVRAELVHLARDRAAHVYGCDFGGAATVLVGDTPLDVGAALATGARAVGVATGQFTAEELAASGAHAVLPDLADTDRTLAAILGPERA